MRPTLPLLSLLLAPLCAQDPEEGRIRLAIGLGAGRFAFDTETDAGASLDDSTSAGFARFQFEGTSARGFGGGVRFEGLESDDDLFADSGFASSDAALGSLFGHFTYRFEEHRFAMPLRVGLLLNGLTLTESGTALETRYASVGPYFEIAPEITIAKSGRTAWSLYGELGFGAGATRVEFDQPSGNELEFDSSTGFFGLELGTRLRFGAFELGFAYIGRWQSMDDSDPEGGLIAVGYDADYQGGLISFGIVF
jgi:hypothetical protein